MGLPDFHSIETGFKASDYVSTPYIHSTLALETVYSYSGFGETIGVEIQIDEGTAPINLGDVIYLFIDSKLISYSPLAYLLFRNIVAGSSILSVIYHIPRQRMIIMFLKGLKFNSTFSVQYLKREIGDLNLRVDGSFGLY